MLQEQDEAREQEIASLGEALKTASGDALMQQRSPERVIEIEVERGLR